MVFFAKQVRGSKVCRELCHDVGKESLRRGAHINANSGRWCICVVFVLGSFILAEKDGIIDEAEPRLKWTVNRSNPRKELIDQWLVVKLVSWEVVNFTLAVLITNYIVHCDRSYHAHHTS